ncbi:MFS transporter, partial [Alphaproteobacteria bacterium]|nr:MFS transporter [Alphaproteobacteria bacterium]
MSSVSIDDLFERYGPAYRWLAFVTCMLGAMTMVLTQTTVNVAFPAIMGAFGIGRDQAQWLSSGFFAAMTAGMLVSAWLISVFGERTVYVVCLALFLGGSAASGIAPNTETLMAGRFLQGVTAGIIQPMAMALTFKVFPPDRRGTAMGLFSMGIVFAP